MRPDIPTAVSAVEAEALAALSHGKKVLEVGSLLGFSTITMALNADHVTSLDPHTGYPKDNPRPTWDKFLNNLGKYRVGHKVRAIKGYDAELGKPPLINERFDFAFIDATGLYQDTFRILTRVWPLMRGLSIVAVHDYGLHEWPGAKMAVDEFCTHLTVGHLDTLALIRKYPDTGARL